MWPIRVSRSSAHLTATVLAVIACLAVRADARQAQPTFKTTVTHVLIDVVVTDKDDRPVTDLTSADFEISEAGRKQTIADFEFVSVPPAERSIDLAATPSPSPDVASNAPPPRTGRAVVFVLDDATLQTRWIVPIKRWMTQFLGDLMPDDEVAITYVSRSDLGQDFTHDIGRLVTAVNNLTGAMVAGADSGRNTLPVLKNVITSIAQARETRRVVVFVGEGFLEPLPGTRYGDEVVALYKQAREAGVPFYALHPVGLMASELGLEGHLEDQTPENRAALDHASAAGKEGMIAMALNTGGRAFVNQSDTPRAIREIMTENGAYYLLGYYPNPAPADGKFHDVKTTVTRPGLHVRARAGYTAKKVVTPFARPRLVDALGDGTPGGDLLMHAFAAPTIVSGRSAKTILTLDIDYPEATGNARRADDELRLAWMALDPDAHVRASGQNAVRVPMARAIQNGFTISLNNVLDLPRGNMVLRVVVASTALGKQAIVHLPIAVPGWSGKSLDATPLVLGTTVARTSMLVSLGSSARVLPFQPTTLRTLGPMQELSIYARLLAPRPDAVTAEFSIKRGDVVARRVPAQLTHAAGDKNALDCRASLALTGLAAGPYVLELLATAGTEQVHRAVIIEIH